MTRKPAGRSIDSPVKRPRRRGVPLGALLVALPASVLLSASMAAPGKAGATGPAHAFATTGPASPGAPRVVEMTPGGTIKRPSQATVSFATPMIALGDPRAAAPASVSCTPEARGAGRWIDSRHWVFDFDAALPGGERCSIGIAAGLRDLAGHALEPTASHGFSTGGPSIVSLRPDAGSTIVEDQAFAVELDAEATAASIESQVHLVAVGLPEKIEVTVADAATRDAVLATDRWWEPRGPVVVLVPRRKLPPEAKVQLVWGRGVSTPGGATNDADGRLAFVVRPALRGEVRCERENARAGCVPITPITLRFTESVPADLAARIGLVAADGTRFPQAPADGSTREVERVTFRGPFPPSSELRLELPQEIRDEAGRPLQNLEELRSLPVRVDATPPLAKFGARFGVLEAKGEPALPVTIRGLEPEAMLRMRALGGPGDAGALVRGSLRKLPADRPAELIRGLLGLVRARRDRSALADAPAGEVKSMALPQPEGAAMQVVGLPMPGPGVYVVELASTELGRVLLDAKQPMYVATAAVVTDLAVHLERGVERSLAWVTSLDAGKPVAGAEVAVHDCAGTVLTRARTGDDGIAWFDHLPAPGAEATCKDPADATGDDADQPDRFWNYAETSSLSSLSRGLFVTARLGDDLGFVHSSWQEGIEGFRFDLPFDFAAGNPPTRAHTVLARNLLRAGETAHMKHVLRAATGRGFGPLPADERPTKVVLRHEGSGAEVEFPLAWSDDGSAESEWKIPREARLGLYDVILRRPARAERRPPAAGPTPAPTPAPTPPPPYVTLHEPAADEYREWTTGSLRVEEFRIPLLKTTLRLPGGPEVAPDAITADVASTYMAGGPAAGRPVVVRSRLGELAIDSPPEFGGFRFGGGSVRTGIERHSSTEQGAGDDGEESGAGATADRGVFRREEARLDGTGSARVTIDGFPAVTRPRRLRVEAEVRDPNGETQTTSASLPIWPASHLVALNARPDPRHARRGAAEAAVMDTARKPVAGARVDVDLFEQTTYTTRQRIVGGFFSYQNVTETRRVGAFCRGRTDASGRMRCRHGLPASRDYLLQATVRDEAGRASTDVAWLPLGGDDSDWPAQTDDDRMDVIAERRAWEPGETARLRARLPFREASALVSVVREGVLEARVLRLSRADASFEVPIRASYSPNVFVHVLAVRGRVGSVQPTARLDLGKPAFRMGIARLEVGWKPHRLDVRVAPEREVFHPRERARVRITATAADGSRLAPGANVAVAAVDEGLLEMLPNDSWKLLDAMMGVRSDLVETSTAQLQVIGKRHFGKKASPSGGGGGSQPTREIFDSLLLWSDRVALDADGRAEVEIPLNDSLTAFRIVAVATSGDDRFGTGEATIRSTQDLMVLSGLPPVVRSGDRFRAPFTVRNASARALDVEVAARVPELGAPDLAPQKLRLEPGESQVVGWEVEVPVGVDALSWQLDARTSDRGGGVGEKGASDRLAVRERVAPAVPVRTLQATLAQWSPPGPLLQPVAIPAGAIPGAGGVSVGVSASLAAGLDGVRAWMRDYPYSCLEQRVSRAVALGDPAGWRDVVGRLPALQDDEGLLRFFPSTTRGSTWLTGYVLQVAHAAGLELPATVEEKMKSALRSFVEGNLRGRPDESNSALRKLGAIAALASASDRGVDPALLGGITIEPASWPTHAALDWWEILRRSPGLPERERWIAEVKDVLRARLDLSGTTLAFAADSAGHFSDGFGDQDVDAARLLLGAIDGDAWVEDQPRLVRGALARQRRGAWSGTVANAWGTIATQRFVATHEKDPVSGTTTVALADAAPSIDWAKQPAGGTISLAWPAAGADLAVDHRGTGLPWVAIRATAAVPLSEPISAGFRIRRSVEPIERRSPDRWSVGDTMRVRIEVDAGADQGWTVVDDPVPPGATYLARGFANDAMLANPAATPAPGVSATFEERAFEGFRAYYESVGAGRLVAEYSIRLNQAGDFHLPPTHVEALYAPEAMGDAPNAPLEVVE